MCPFYARLKWSQVYYAPIAGINLHGIARRLGKKFSRSHTTPILLKIGASDINGDKYFPKILKVISYSLEGVA
jgi:hypothetical protein